MVANNMEIKFHIVWWFFCDEFGFFSIDEMNLDDLRGIIEQLSAEQKGLTK